MKIELNIPDKLSDITLGQYQRFDKIQQQFEEKTIDEVALKINIISIFCGIQKDNVRKIKGAQVEQMLDIIMPMLTEKVGPLKHRFELNNKEYGFSPNLEDMTFGEYVAADTFIPKWENMHRVMGILFRPILRRHGETYSIEEYKVSESLEFKDMPLDICFSSLFFLTSLGLDLLKNITDYLAKQPSDKQQQKLTLNPNGGGMGRFTASLKEILEQLKISQLSV